MSGKHHAKYQSVVCWHLAISVHVVRRYRSYFCLLRNWCPLTKWQTQDQCILCLTSHFIWHAALKERWQNRRGERPPDRMLYKQVCLVVTCITLFRKCQSLILSWALAVLIREFSYFYQVMQVNSNILPWNRWQSVALEYTSHNKPSITLPWSC